MAVQELTPDTFEGFLKEKPVALVDFTATWCAPCQMIKPIIEQLHGEYNDRVNVGAVDIDSNQELAIQFDVSAVPTLAFFKNGEPVETVVGLQSKDALAQRLEDLLA